MKWDGLEWTGLEWMTWMEWNRMEWNATERNGTEGMNGMKEWNGLEWTGRDWNGMKEWNGLEWTGRDWNGMKEWNGLEWIGRDWNEWLGWTGLDWSGLDWNGMIEWKPHSRNVLPNQPVLISSSKSARRPSFFWTFWSAIRALATVLRAFSTTFTDRCPQPRKQRPYFGDPRSHFTRKTQGFARVNVFTREFICFRLPNCYTSQAVDMMMWLTSWDVNMMTRLPLDIRP